MPQHIKPGNLKPLQCWMPGWHGEFRGSAQIARRRRATAGEMRHQARG